MRRLQRYKCKNCKYHDLRSSRILYDLGNKYLEKSADREYRQKLRTGEESRTDRVKEKAGELLALPYDEKDLIKKLRSAGLEFYR